MRKKLFSILLSLAMVVTMMPAMSMTAYADGPQTYTVSSWAQLKTKIHDAFGGDTIKLDQEITAPAGADNLVFTSEKALTLDLNGYSLDRDLDTVSDDGYVLFVNGGDLTVISSRGGGTITGGYATYGGGIKVNGGGKLTFKSGSICNNNANSGAGIYISDASSEAIIDGGTINGNTANYHGGGIYSNLAKVTLKSGIITYNDAYKGGGGVYARGEFTMLDGEISHNNAGMHGGGVYVYGSNETPSATKSLKTTISGGTIKNNHADQLGGGIMLDKYDMTLEMFGCQVANNSADIDGGGIFTLNPVTFGGTAKVNSNNVATTICNTVISGDALVKVATSEHAPQQGMNIGVTKAGFGVFSDVVASGTENYFFADATGYSIRCNSENKLEIFEGSTPGGGGSGININTDDEEKLTDAEITDYTEDLKVVATKSKALKNGKITIWFNGLKLKGGKKITKYQVWRKVKGGKYKLIKVINRSNAKNSYTNVKNLKKGKTYYYKVRGMSKLSTGKNVYTNWSKVVKAKCLKTR